VVRAQKNARVPPANIHTRLRRVKMANLQGAVYDRTYSCIPSSHSSC
jgi:hypothetical protein